MGAPAKKQNCSEFSFDAMIKLHPEYLRSLMKIAGVADHKGLHEALKSNITLLDQYKNSKKKDTSFTLKVGENKIKPRELELMLYQIEGMTVAETSAAMDISLDYAKEIVAITKTKFGVKTLLQLGFYFGIMLGEANS
ncbi:helix-turn-helix transcriptional regulator [Cysteiniphilum litorale]|uniref:helix-turn-helix transcriptional regulator n=1 Tax=Cysteiniphilum litorale TaxID=2056700 RepID=UPI003F883DD9